MCDCIQKVNEELEKKGLTLITNIQFAADMKTAVSFIPLATQKIDKGNRKIKTLTLAPSFCPFCGKKIVYNE